LNKTNNQSCKKKSTSTNIWISTTFLSQLIYRLIHFRPAEHCWLALVAWCGSMSRHGEQQESSPNLVQPNHRLNTAEDCSVLTWLSYCTTTTVQCTAGSDAWGTHIHQILVHTDRSKSMAGPANDSAFPWRVKKKRGIENERIGILLRRSIYKRLVWPYPCLTHSFTAQSLTTLHKKKLAFASFIFFSYSNLHANV
jgi:hypothetical protein